MSGESGYFKKMDAKPPSSGDIARYHCEQHTQQCPESPYGRHTGEICFFCGYDETIPYNQLLETHNLIDWILNQHLNINLLIFVTFLISDNKTTSCGAAPSSKSI
jgi:hypothetical protein